MFKTMGLSQISAALILLGAGLVLLLKPVPDAQLAPLALSIVTLGFWATAVLPEYLTSLIFLTVAMIFAVAPGNIIFSGFQAPALWLILGGLVMGVAVRTTGLGHRVAIRLSSWFGQSYWGVIGGILAVGTLLGFCMPSSMGRVIILMPIALSLADGYGFVPGTRGRTGVVLAAAFGCHVSTFSILPANVPNVVLAGAAESLYHFTFTYGRYLLIHFPVLGLLKTLLVTPLIVWGWPDTPKHREHPPATPMSNAEKGLTVLLVTALTLWATDAVHHVSPAWISMVVGIVLLLPKIGLVDTKSFNQDVNFGSLFYVGGVISLGSLVDQSGLGGHLADGFQSIVTLTPGHTFQNMMGVGVIGTLVSVIATLTAAPAVLTPLAAHLAQATGFSLEAVLHMEVLGFSNPLFTYESPPLVVALALGGVGIRTGQKLCICISLITMFVLWPLDYLWLGYLGLF